MDGQYGVRCMHRDGTRCWLAPGIARKGRVRVAKGGKVVEAKASDLSGFEARWLAVPRPGSNASLAARMTADEAREAAGRG